MKKDKSGSKIASIFDERWQNNITKINPSVIKFKGLEKPVLSKKQDIETVEKFLGKSKSTKENFRIEQNEDALSNKAPSIATRKS
mgnify:FL=1|jgi:hypothetical protein